MKKIIALFCLMICPAYAQISPGTGSLSQNTQIGTPAITDTGVAIQATNSVAGYYQFILQNTSNNAGASADYIVNNNLGTSTTYYGDYGMNSSTFTGTGSLALPNAVYLYSQTGDLVLGTNTTNTIHFVINNGATDAMQIASNTQINMNGVNLINYPSVDTGANHSLGLGSGALTNIGTSTAAFDNTAVGYSSLSGILTTAGTQNTALGSKALMGVTSGSGNVGLGYQAAFQNNASDIVAIGIDAAQYPSSNDVAIGAFSLYQGSGGSNVAIGYGAMSGGGSSSLSASVALGYNVMSTLNMTGSHNIALGTSNSCALSAAGASNETHICGSGGDSILITGTGTATTETATVHGVFKLPDITSTSTAQQGTLCWATGGTITYDTTLGCLSSLAEYKRDVKPYNNALKTVMSLRPKTYFYKDGHDPDEQIGLIAQDVEKTDKRLVAYDLKTGALRGVRYNHLGVVDAEAIQELYMIIEKQQYEIEHIREGRDGYRCWGILWCKD